MSRTRAMEYNAPMCSDVILLCSHMSIIVLYMQCSMAPTCGCDFERKSRPHSLISTSPHLEHSILTSSHPELAITLSEPGFRCSSMIFIAFPVFSNQVDLARCGQPRRRGRQVAPATRSRLPAGAASAHRARQDGEHRQPPRSHYPFVVSLANNKVCWRLVAQSLGNLWRTPHGFPVLNPCGWAGFDKGLLIPRLGFVISGRGNWTSATTPLSMSASLLSSILSPEAHAFLRTTSTHISGTGVLRDIENPDPWIGLHPTP